MSLIARAGQFGRSPYDERGPDLYETHPSTVRALVAAQKLPARIWEPACGRGAIVGVLRGAGHRVLASDLHDHGAAIPKPFYSGRNFLHEQLPAGTQAIITNPPFKLANEFVDHATTICPWVAMLLRLAYLEGSGRTKLLEQRGLARVIVFRNRLPMMHRDGWAGTRGQSAVPFAWFVWRREYRGEPRISRITWKDTPPDPV